MFAPLIFPFEPWRIKHNQHHAHTNKLVEDTAWHPVMESEVEARLPAPRARPLAPALGDWVGGGGEGEGAALRAM